MQILLVEPSASYQGLVASILNNAGAKTMLAASGEEALARLEHAIPDAICVAHELGDMDSRRFIAELRNIGLSNAIPKFLLTSRQEEAFRRDSFDLGFTDVLHKSDMPAIRRGLQRLVSQANEVLSGRVLYVEDVLSTAGYTSELLMGLGLEVVHVRTGEEALALLEVNNFDLVITDLVLAGDMSGMGLVAGIREGADRFRCLPILAISGWNDPVRQVYVLKQGASDFVSKPINASDFLARVVNLIHDKKARDDSMALQQDLQRMATTDQLTGLCNRHSLYDLGEQMIKVAAQAGEQVALLMIDIDYFKQINDHYGHDVGDRVLRDIGSMIRQHCRQGDLAARFGGEEFVVLMRNCNAEVAMRRAEQFRCGVEQLPLPDIGVTASIGVATSHHRSGDTLGSMFKAADLAVYAAKQQGRNRVCRAAAEQD